ncbi:MAG: lanthionine synthetase LanC family protein [Nitrososphaeraceae archaeon]
MNPYLNDIKSVVHALIIHSFTAYSWLGQKQSVSSFFQTKKTFPHAIARNYLLSRLTSRLYEDFYCRGEPMNTLEGVPVRHIPYGLNSFAKKLSSCNLGHGRIQKGWKVISVNSKNVTIIKNGLYLLLEPKDCLISRKNQKISVGMNVSILLPKESLEISPGFYMVFGNKSLDTNNSQILRFYWNITSGGAATLIKYTTSILNQLEIPFNLKTLNNPDIYNRRVDTAVLYIHKNDYEIVSKYIEKIYFKVYGYLNQQTPVFTKKLAKGLGLAEDPGKKESFGQHRCKILADAIIMAYEEGKKDLFEQIEFVIARFKKEGINIEKPFLNPNSIDKYEIDFSRQDKVKLEYYKILRYRNNQTDNNIFLKNAIEIGNKITNKAIWDKYRCNWLGIKNDLSYASLGPDLYYGTSGVSIFLAKMYENTKIKQFRTTAIGAIYQALSSVQSIPKNNRLGLYTGRMGVYFATALVGKILRDNDLITQASNLVNECICEKQSTNINDIISGKAGTIITLLAFRDIIDDNKNKLLNFASTLGEELISTAESKNGYSWSSPSIKSSHNLTGFSHGAAGIGYALLHLFRETGDNKFKQTAQLAFEYERYYFDSSIGNWPDFRNSSFSDVHSYYTSTWCHGAPGISISRILAYKITRESRYKNEAITALKRTCGQVKKMLNSGLENYSLCHGLGGNCDLILYGKESLGREFDVNIDKLNIVYQVGIMGIEKYSKKDSSWPCGIQNGETPSLMIGLAGIGYFYLRISDPEKNPSLLVIK